MFCTTSAKLKKIDRCKSELQKLHIIIKVKKKEPHDVDTF